MRLAEPFWEWWEAQPEIKALRHAEAEAARQRAIEEARQRADAAEAKEAALRTEVKGLQREVRSLHWRTKIRLPFQNAYPVP